MNTSENQEDFSLYGSNREYYYPSSQAQQQKIDRFVVAKAIVVLILVTMIALHCSFIFSNRQLSQKQVDFQANLKDINNSVIFFQRDLISFNSTSLKYDLEEDEKRISLKQKISSLYSEAFSSDSAVGFEDGEKDLRKIQQTEDRQQERKVQLDMVDANLKELYRNERIQLFQKIGNSTEFQPIHIKNPWNLTRLNFQTPYMDTVQKKMFKEWIQNQTDRLNIRHQIHLVFSELPICVVSPTLNNAQNYRYEYSLQSILNQNYSNYKIVIIDQGSKDSTADHIHKFMRKSGKSPKEYTFIQSANTKSKMQALSSAINEHCHPEDIVVIVHGSDEILGTKTFQLLNTKYLRKNISVLYSNYFKGYYKQKIYTLGNAKEYKEYRQKERMYGSFVTFKAKLFQSIKEQDFKFRDGSWLDWRDDETYLVPILEMSCGKTEHLVEYLYLVNLQSDQHPQQYKNNSTSTEYIKTLKPYECYKDAQIKK